jgi:CheY-like chemotaxis protein
VTAPPPDPDLAGRRVLVVEDEMLVAMLVEDILAQLGCTVVGPAARIAEALPMARSEALDCAFLDVNVAGERVFPVAAALAERRVPFVFVSGYGEDALEAPFADRPALRKPFPPSEIEAVLRRCLTLPAKGN